MASHVGPSVYWLDSLHRLLDPYSAGVHQLVLRDLQEPGYKTLRENPLILTLLTHVLRRHHQMSHERGAAGVVDDAAQAQKRELMKKTEVYKYG